jgi:Periplasmic protease
MAARWRGAERAGVSRHAHAFRRETLSVLCALLAALLLAGCVSPPSEYREPPPLAVEARPAHNQKVFDRAWELVNDKYFDASFRGVDWRAMRERYRPRALAAKNDDELYQAINDMCAELKESHLVALTPRRAHERRVEHRPAIGLRWTEVEGARVVADVLPGGPAMRAGVERGWLIVSRNGEPLRANDDFVMRLGEPVTFEFLDRENGRRTLSMRPALVNFERVETFVLEDGAVYLRFDRFALETANWLRQQMRKHRDAPAVVIDLRENRGGDTFSLRVALAEFFDGKVEEGTIVKRNGRTRKSHSFGWGATRYGGRVLVLIGPGTGSAAEIFSHVLQHHGRATVIGRRTAGAVIHSRFYRLPGGGELQVPVSDYVGLDGQRLEGKGVVPDIELPMPTLAERRAVRDLEMGKAAEILKKERSR